VILYFFTAPQCLARYMLSPVRPSVRPFVCPSVRLSVRMVYHRKTAEVTIMKFLPYAVIFAG